MQLDFLKGLRWEPAVKSRLQKLSTSLLRLYDETYSQTLESRAEEEQNLTKNALRMLLCLQTPLRTGDFMFALCSCEEAELSAEDLVDLCSSFVVLDTTLGIFRFAHLSVREFLETKDDYEPDKSHALMAKICLKYLSTNAVTQGTKKWNYEHAGSEVDSGKDRPISSVLVHKHASTAPACDKLITLMSKCDSCGREVQGPFWHCLTPELHLQGFCGECVEKGRICRSQERCPLRTSPMYQSYTITDTIVPEDTSIDENEDGSADGSIRTLSFVPVFLNGFHQYSCLYWPLHLNGSQEHRLSTPLQTIFQDFMIGEQQTASTPFVSWSNNILLSSRAPYPEITWGYKIFANRRVVDGISLPADCIFIAAIWDFCDILELRLNVARLNVEPEAVNKISQSIGSSALHLASAYGSVKAAQLLVEKGASLKERDHRGNTTLGTAVDTQQPAIVSLLLERGADVGIKQYHYYPLQQAVRKGHLAIIQSLLKYGAAPDELALTLAVANGNEEAMNLLLDNLTNTDSSIKILWRTVTRIQKATQTEGEAGLTQYLSTWPTSTTASRLLGIVLWRAVKRKDEACTRLLLAREADPNTVFESTPVFELAARPVVNGDFGQIKFVEMLLARGANPNIGRAGRILLAQAVDYDRLDQVRLFADAGADLNGDALVRAVRNRNVEIVRFLLEKGADAKEVGVKFFAGKLEPSGMFAGHSLGDSEEIRELLLAYGATR